ncbi:hypothetical protein POVWA2_052620 [Plasmodium ovale wallikeri]|uniref:Uncharacterized protein n=1 Tax=Plasmodium ovale wallikeri TaxID=864142 RepID=A0A1A8ZSB8_PLAOA|nr:hypothetical protein POVWA1_053350 [Plasmodium ovale wallikeri]SBT46777.1 hypothetical protein POVWA2_052620 [Plasmodium ovale wallikeri]
MRRGEPAPYGTFSLRKGNKKGTGTQFDILKEKGKSYKFVAYNFENSGGNAVSVAEGRKKEHSGKLKGR